MQTATNLLTLRTVNAVVLTDPSTDLSCTIGYHNPSASDRTNYCHRCAHMKEYTTDNKNNKIYFINYCKWHRFNYYLPGVPKDVVY